MLDWVIDTTQQFLAEHILLTVAVVLFIEELGVPLFAPGDILMVLAGIEVARGNAILWQVLLVEQVVTMAGATLLYYASRRLGRPALVKYGGYIGMDPERLEVMEAQLRQYQFRAVVLGRLTPGLRILIVIAAGLANLEARRFLPALALGSFLYLLLYTLVGMYAGEAAIRLITQLSIPASALLSLLALGVLALGLRHARRSRFLAQPLTPSLLTNLGAGVVAATVGLMASNIVNGVVVVWSRFGEPIDTTPYRGAQLLGQLLTWPGFLVVTLTLATVVPLIGLRHRARLVRFIVNAVLPFGLAILIVDPALFGGDAGWDSRTALAWAAVEASRFATFAVTLEYMHEQMFSPRHDASTSGDAPESDPMLFPR